MAQAARPDIYRSGSTGAPEAAQHHAPRPRRAHRAVPAPPPQPVPAQSDAVDARDLARRLEIYSIELQLRAQSRPGRSVSPPLRKRPPPDSPSVASSPEYDAAGTPGRQRSYYSRRESVVPDGAVKSVEAQRSQTKRTSTIEARPVRGTQARPQSLHPDYADARLTQAVATSSRRQSRYSPDASTVPVGGDSRALITSQVGLANLQTPQTSEEAVKVLAALAQQERMLTAQYEQSVSQSRPATASSAALDSPATPLSVYSAQQAAVDLVSPAGPGAVRPVQVHRSTLSREVDGANGVYTRDASHHAGGVRDTGAQAKAPMSRGEKLRITVPEGASSRTTAAQSPIKRGTTASSSGKRKSGISVANTELTVPSFPNSPLPSPGAISPLSPGSSQSRYKSGYFDEEAFIAMVRKPRGDDAVREADRRSRVVSTSMSTANHRLSASSMQAFGLPVGQPVSVNTTEPAPAEPEVTEDSRKAKQKVMRSKGVKDAAIDRSRPADTGMNQAAAEAASRPPQRAASKGAASGTASTPNKLKKTGKSPGNSRPPSRAATVTSITSRSRAASQVTSPLSISAIEQVNFPTPVPPAGAAVHALLRPQKPVATARETTSQAPPHEGPQAQSTPHLFPELAPDQSRSTLIPQAGSLSHSKSLGNFSRPNGHPPDKTVLPLTMPAPPDAVYRATARHRATSSATTHSLRGVRSFQNDKGKAYDQTRGMTGGSLALLQKMEAEVARREGVSRAASRAHSRAGSRLPHSRIASRVSLVLGGWTYDDSSAGSHTVVAEKGASGAAAPREKKKRGCCGFLG